jgi:hypothetical protein
VAASSAKVEAGVGKGEDRKKKIEDKRIAKGAERESARSAIRFPLFSIRDLPSDGCVASERAKLEGRW